LTVKADGRWLVPKLVFNGFYSLFRIWGTALSFASLLNFLAVSALLEPAKVPKTAEGNGLQEIDKKLLKC
jgi:hypothetical protein